MSGAGCITYNAGGGELMKVFMLHKISSDVRHTGGSDFIHEKYLQNTIKWDFRGTVLNVPADVDKIVQEVDFDVFVTGPDQCHAGFQHAI